VRAQGARLQYAVDKYPQLQVKRFNGQEDTALLQYLGLRANVPEERQLVAPRSLSVTAISSGRTLAGAASKR